MKTDSQLQQDVMDELKRINDMTTHCARITGPITYPADDGRKQHIPLGPCLIEGIGGPSIDIIWGERGQSSAALPVEDIRAARDHGHLVLLD